MLLTTLLSDARRLPLTALLTDARRRRRIGQAPDPAVRDLRVWFTVRAAEAARAELAPLLEEAAELDLGDEDAVAWLRERSHRLTRRLVASGQLPAHLVVSPRDPGAVVVRTLAGAWRGVTPTPRRDGPAGGE